MVSVLAIIKDIHNMLGKNKIYKILLFTILVMIACALWYHHFESKVDPTLTLWDAMWWSFVTLTTVGYGDYFPVTLGGRLVASVLMITGIGIFGFITATVAATFVDNILKKGSGRMEVKTKNHIVVIGWNKKAKTIITELVNEKTGKNIVVISKKENIDLNDKGTVFIHGEEADDKTLERAHIEDASLVIVLADETLENEQMMDAKSVLICLAVDNINPKVHLVSEVMDEKNLSHFKRANVNDTVVTSQISSKIIVRSSLYKHVSNTLEELMTNSYGNEIYEKEASNNEIGNSFGNLLKEYIDTQKGILVGISDGDKTMVNPDKDYVIKQNDILVYISQDKLV